VRIFIKVHEHIGVAARKCIRVDKHIKEFNYKYQLSGLLVRLASETFWPRKYNCPLLTPQLLIVPVHNERITAHCSFLVHVRGGGVNYTPHVVKGNRMVKEKNKSIQSSGFTVVKAFSSGANRKKKRKKFTCSR
jgi:hypothetical protein